jgi:polyisoprenoid-binding protein YceI
MNRLLISMATAAALFISEAATAPAPGPRPFEFDAASGTLEVDVGKAGLLKAFGHEHVIAAKEFAGRILLDPEKMEDSSVTLRVAAHSLAVADKEISDADRAQVQSTMLGDRVLDVERFPEVAFASTAVTHAQKSGDAWSLTLAGKLRLHGLEREVTLPVTLTIAGAELEARGEVSLLQTDYGITPVKAGGGMVKVKDDLRIRFNIHARSTAP